MEIFPASLSKHFTAFYNPQEKKDRRERWGRQPDRSKHPEESLTSPAPAARYSSLASQSQRVTAPSRRAGCFEIGSQEATAVVICATWARCAQGGAPNAGPRCVERLVEACCDPSSYDRLGDAHGGQEDKHSGCTSPQHLCARRRPRKHGSLISFQSD